MQCNAFNVTLDSLTALHTHQFVYDTCVELQQKVSSLHLKPGEMDCFMMVVNACTRIRITTP